MSSDPWLYKYPCVIDLLEILRVVTKHSIFETGITRFSICALKIFACVNFIPEKNNYMENPHEQQQAALLKRIVNNVVK